MVDLESIFQKICGIRGPHDSDLERNSFLRLSPGLYEKSRLAPEIIKPFTRPNEVLSKN